MLQRAREFLTLVLIALLPLHAFGVTVLTKLIVGPGQAPLAWLAVWKEGVLGVILVLALGEMIASRKQWKAESGKWAVFPIDLIDGLILVLLLLAGALLALGYPASLGQFALGFKYDFVPLVAFLVLRRVPWSEEFRARAIKIILWIGGIFAAYGILSFFFPQQFFVALGYSDLHSLYVPGGPLAAFQQIGGEALRRVQSTFSGPNQFGLWLLLPWIFALISFLLRLDVRWLAYFLLVDTAIFLTFSRSAWIAAVVIGCIAIVQRVPKRARVGTAAGLGGLIAVVLIGIALLFPSVFVRAASSRDHLLRPMEAIRTIMAHPLGLGLGTAGPASNRVSDPCVHLEIGANASWAADRPELCVFVGEMQVQPPISERGCNCPFLPENWYLQIGVELGIAGLILYLTLIVIVVGRALRVAKNLPLHTSVALAFLGVSIAGLFLHAWEDSAVAYTVWLLVSGVIPFVDPKGTSSHP